MLSEPNIKTGLEGWTGFKKNMKTTDNGKEDITTTADAASASSGNQEDYIEIRNSVGNLIGYIKKDEVNRDFDTEKTVEHKKRVKMGKAMDRETEKNENKVVRRYEKVVDGMMQQHIKDIRRKIAELKQELKEHEKKLKLDITKRQRKLEIDIKESKKFEKELKKRKTKKETGKEKHRKKLLKNEMKHRKQLLKDEKRKAKRVKEDDRRYLKSLDDIMKSCLKDSELKWEKEIKVLKACMQKKK